MSTATITIEMENPAVLTVVKSFLRQMKGIASVKVSRKPKTKMSEAEFYQMVESSRKSAAEGNVVAQQDGETVHDFLNRLLCTE